MIVENNIVGLVGNFGLTNPYFKRCKMINLNVKSIKEDGYSFVYNQCLKVGTHIFSLGSIAEDFEIYEQVVTDEVGIDECGYPCIVLEDVNGKIFPVLVRIEVLVCSLHTHCSNDYLTKEEAEEARMKKLKEVYESAVSKEKNYGRKY